MDFDKFVTEFNGQIDVLSDAMNSLGISKEEKELIYEDLLQKIVLRMKREDLNLGLYVQNETMISPGEESPEEKGFYKSWTPLFNGPNFHMKKVRFVEVYGTSYVYETYYTTSNQPYRYCEIKYSHTEKEAMQKMIEQMRKFGGRILL